MRQNFFAVAATLLAFSGVSFAGTNYVVPTTTLSAQTANNTSAANGFATQSNGNRGAGNISKVDVHSLLYSGAATKIYAHMMVWFGQSNHMNVGYSSTDPAQVTSQINDMISRGIDGVIIDWYGPNNSKDQATQLVMAEAEKHPGFTFAIMVDQGAIKDYSCSGCSAQQALTSIMQYAEQTYFSSPAYMTNSGQPVVTNFDIDLSYTIDWNALNASLSTHPLFFFQNNSGFTHVLSDGSYSWVMPTTTDYGMSYLTSFYDTGVKYPGLQTVGATYKGFNDSLAAWGSGRIMSQQCGQTWLQTFSEINGLYNSGKPLADLQLVTWNDYEEATELESGIENCFSLSASVASNSVQWTIKGNENTVDHYTVYISTDGQNLMPLAENVAGNRSLNLCGFPIPAGSYQLLVQAVGKPSMANAITSSLPYSPTCSSGGSSSTATLTFSASPTAVTIPSGQSGTLTVTAKPQSGSFNSAITLACSGIPSGWQCAFSPATITPGQGTATSTLTISAAAVASTSFPQRGNSLPIKGAWLLPVGMIGFVFAGGKNRRRNAQTLALFAVLGLGLFSASCGGAGGSKVQSAAVPATSNYTVTIVGSSAPVQLSTTVNIVVQ